MIAVRGFVNARVGVLGLGRSGVSTARALVAGGAHPVCWDDNPDARARAAADGFTVEDLRNAKALACLVVSPGIAHLFPTPHPAVRAALMAGVPVDNDIGLFFRSLAVSDWDRFDQPPRVIAVTGSNGKSTTSALIAHVLDSVGREVQLAGNIGRGVLDIDPPGDGDLVVLELSSYQTELARALTPDIAVFTNLSPDHLDRHGGFGGYFAAKRRLFSEGGPDRAIVGIDEDAGLFLAGQLSEGAADDRVIRVARGKATGSAWQVLARKGFLAEWRKGRQVASLDLRGMQGLAGAHNHQNACACYAVCRSLGLAPRVIESALASFAGLAHRSQFVVDHGGVRVINDSKATNVDSALQALLAFERVHWICGGQQKEGGLDGLAAGLNHVVQAYVIGQDAAAFAQALPQDKVQICGDMRTAVASALGAAQPDEVVLLAPAAASFDQYDSFEARGQDFMQCVAAVLAKLNSASA